MQFRLPLFKILALTFAGLAVAYLLFGWLILPRIIQTQAEKFIAEKTGHHLTMNRPEFNPLKFSLHLSGLTLTQPDNEPLLAFRDLVVDLSATSIYRSTLTFDSIRLDGLEATAILLPKGKLNWSALIDAFKSKDNKQEEATNSSLPKLDIHQFILADARLNFTDKRTSSVFSTRIEPLNVELTDISTLPNEKGQYRVSAHTALGASIIWQGEASLAPLVMNGSIKVEDIDFARLSPLFKNQLPIAPPTGKARLSTEYSMEFASGQMDLKLEHIATKITGLALHGNTQSSPDITIDTIEAKEGRFNLKKGEMALGSISVSGSKLDLQQGKTGAKKVLELGNLNLEDLHVNMLTHNATLGNLALKGGRVRVSRNSHGHIDLMDALQAVSAPNRGKPQDNQAKDAAKAHEAGWHYRVNKIQLADFAATLRDESISPAAELVFNNIALGVEDISENWKMPVPFRASFKAGAGGSFAAEGKIIPSEPSADIRLKLSELSLTPAQPYLSAVTKLKLVDGRLSTEGQAIYNKKEAAYKGSFSLNSLRLTEAESGNVFLAWKSLASRKFKASPQKLDIGELNLSGLDTQLIINKDKTLSVTRILKQPAAVATTKPATPPVSSTTKPAHPFLVNIDRFRLNNCEMDFADYSLALPFGTRIHDLQGTISGISSQPGSPGQLELEGQVDEYGLARAVGQVDFLNPTDLLDLKVVFRNVEMTRLTPYSATFAGRKIASGKLSLDLAYKIHQRQLQGENKVVMDQLVLGDRIDSPDAKNLPLDLALAILKDSDGRIDLGLPVSGDLNDPQFSYGGIIWKAFANVVTKIATAPFRALGALFGGGEKFENIAFEAGNAQLTPPEREKLLRLADALSKRPNLSLEIHGVYAEKDRIALQDRQLRRNLFATSGQHLEVNGDPGPVSLHLPKIQAALEKLFSGHFGSAQLESVKISFRQANPGQLKDSGIDKMISGLSGIVREKPPVNEQEVASLKGADFYGILFERLRKVAIVDNEVLALAKARGEFTDSALKAAGVPSERIALQAAEKIDSDGADIPIKLVLGVASQAEKPAASGVAAN